MPIILQMLFNGATHIEIANATSHSLQYITDYINEFQKYEAEHYAQMDIERGERLTEIRNLNKWERPAYFKDMSQWQRTEVQTHCHNCDGKGRTRYTHIENGRCFYCTVEGEI